tara:strand:+ start:393 stop:1229 length:837 start_codon:yes stop_codon:yes gene_type:complete
MRNNHNRLGLEDPTNNLQLNTDVPPTTQAMQFIVPTEIVELPSKGLFYDEGHPLHEKDTVEIRHMTTKEEDILINQSYIKNGIVIDKLIQSVLITPQVNVKDLLVGDKNAITVACRIHGYGPEYETKYTCPSCNNSQTYVFDLNEVSNNDFASYLEEFDAQVDYDRKTITLPIPRTNTKLELKILKDDASSKKAKKKNTGTITRQYEKMIYSVNGNSDRQYVKSYIASMSALDSRYLRAAYAKIVPSVDFTCDFECEQCSFTSEVEVPLNADFFWPQA